MADSAAPQQDLSVPGTPARLPIGTGEFVVIIAGLMALNALAIDVMLPALDDIAAELGVASANDQQLVIYAYIAGFGVPQLVWGPLTDRFGRRPIIFMALGGYALAGIACMFAPSFAVLLATRFCQGVFASACRVVAVSIVRDIFVGRGMARIMSLVMTIFMIVPILAPSIGQLILFLAPWEWTFGVLTLFALALLGWTFARLPETLPPEARRPINPAATAEAYLAVFRTPVTIGYIAASGVIFGALFAFIGSSEQIMTEVFETGETFVLWFALVAMVLAGANFLNSRLVEAVGMRRMSQTALLGFIGLTSLLITLMSVVGQQFALFIPLFALIFGCFGMIGSNFNALAMEPQGRIAGTASAAQGFSTTTVSSFIGWMIGRQYDGTIYPLLTGFLILGATCLAIVLIVERGRLFSAR